MTPPATRFAASSGRRARAASSVWRAIGTLPLAVAILIACPALAVAQQDDAEIAALESAYRDELIAVRKDMGIKWVEALTKLKNQLTQEQKFAEAVLVRDELERVQAMLGADPLPPTTGPAPVRKLTFPASAATLSGEVKFISDQSMIGGWRGIGGAASWEVPADIIPGTYELILNYQCGDGGGGTFRVEIGDDQDLAGSVAATSGPNAWRTGRALLAGECLLDQDTRKLTIISTAHTGELMDITSIVLAPQGTWAELQATADPSTTPDPGADRRPFEKLEGARWIDKPDRQSGEITVSHGGKEYAFSLYFVVLPPTAAPASGYARADVARLAKQLQTTEEQIFRLGKKVDSSLREELWTKDLTIYTRWESRGRAGRNLAYVLVGDTPISLSLVEKGYAHSGGPYPTAAPFLGSEKGSAKLFLSRLQAAEQVAKKSRRGLWGL